MGTGALECEMATGKMHIRLAILCVRYVPYDHYALHVCTCGIGTRVGHGSNTFGSTGSQVPPAPAKGTAAAEKTVKHTGRTE